MKIEDSIAVVQRQLNAYNAKDSSTWLSTYAPDAESVTRFRFLFTPFEQLGESLPADTIATGCVG